MANTSGRPVDLNCDLGESFGRYSIGDDAAVLAWITSANVACGLHAGDPLVIDRVVRLAAERGVSVGAHPGYPDLQGFGRRVMDLTPKEAEAFTLYQVAALAGMCQANGIALAHVKPHGALYNQAAKDPNLAEAIAKGVKRFSNGLVLVGLAGSALLEAGRLAGLHVASEGFPDRAYNPDGSLRSRRLPGALLETTEEICAQAVKLATEGLTIQVGDERQTLPVDTLCIHGDHPQAAERAKCVYEVLEQQGITVKSISA